MLAIILSPLAGFLVSGLAGSYLPKNVTGWISSLAVLISFIFSVQIFQQIYANPAALKHEYFTFLNTGSFKVGFSLSVDRLTAMMMLIVTGIGFLIHVYSISYMHDDKGFYKFFAYLNLFIFNMLILIMGANFLMLFFGWEGVGLCSYLLIGFWYENADYGKAARKAFVMNRIGDLGLLLGLFLIIWQFGTLDYDQVFVENKLLAIQPGIITAICVLLFVGAMGKSAQIPLYTWLPDAMAGPTPVSALIHAATMVTAGIYLVVRAHVLFDLSLFARELVLIIGLCTSILAALIGLKQNDIKKVLAYSTVSQLGFMFIALGTQSYVAAMFHLTTHAFFKALLFLGSGSVIHAMGGEQDIRRMGGLRKAMPITYWTFMLGTLAICGFPFLSGFFSKDEILAEVYKHNVGLWVLCVASAGLTCVYMLRVFVVTFLGSFRGTEDQKHHLHESPALITIPLVILAILSVFGGLINVPPIMSHNIAHGLDHYLSPVVGEAKVHVELSEGLQLILVSATVLLLAGAYVYIRNKYLVKGLVPEEDSTMSGMGKVMANKFYVDEIYNAAIEEPINKGSEITYKRIDRQLIDGLVNGIGKALKWLSGIYGKVQNGNIEYYLLYMVAGIVIIIGINLFK